MRQAVDLSPQFNSRFLVLSGISLAKSLHSERTLTAIAVEDGVLTLTLLCVAENDSFEHRPRVGSVSVLAHAPTTHGSWFAISGRVWTKNPRIGTGRRF